MGEGGSFVSNDHIEETEEVVSNHMIMTRWELSSSSTPSSTPCPPPAPAGRTRSTRRLARARRLRVSDDADSDELSYSWDINGDGVYGDARAKRPN